MALDPAMLREIGSVFLQELNLSAEARRVADYQLDQLAQLLPTPDTWAALGHGDEATLTLVSGDVLLTIGRETAAQDEPQLVVRAQRLRINEVRYRRNDQHTVWDFQFRDRGPLRVEGRMNNPSAPGTASPGDELYDAAETFDQTEAFARALAASMGWRTIEQTPVRDDEPQDDEPTDAGSSGRSGPSRQRVTDMWGNPISKTKRRSR